MDRIAQQGEPVLADLRRKCKIVRRNGLDKVSDYSRLPYSNPQYMIIAYMLGSSIRHEMLMHADLAKSCTVKNRVV